MSFISFLLKKKKIHLFERQVEIKRDRDLDILHALVYSQNCYKNKTGTNGSQESGTPPWSSTWVSRSQAREPSPVSLEDTGKELDQKQSCQTSTSAVIWTLASQTTLNPAP